MSKLFKNCKVIDRNLISKSDLKKINNLSPYLLNVKSKYTKLKLSNKIFLIKDEDGKTKLISYFDKIIPCLSLFDKEKTNFIIVDKGAFKPIKNGSNVMAPGIIKFKDLIKPFHKGEMLGIEILNDETEQKESRIFAIGISLCSYDEMILAGTGEIIEVIHVEGDELENFK